MFSYKRVSFFLGLSLLTSTVVSVNQAHAQSLKTENLEPTASQSASQAGGSSQSSADANSSSSFSDVRNRVKNSEGFKSSLGAADNLNTVTSSGADILKSLEDLLDSQEADSPEASTPQLTELEEEDNPEASTPQLTELGGKDNPEASTSSPSDETGTSIVGNSASLPSELIGDSLPGTSTSLVSEPTAEKIPESSPSLLVWLGLVGAGLVHTKFKSKK